MDTSEGRHEHNPADDEAQKKNSLQNVNGGGARDGAGFLQHVDAVEGNSGRLGNKEPKPVRRDGVLQGGVGEQEGGYEREAEHVMDDVGGEVAGVGQADAEVGDEVAGEEPARQASAGVRDARRSYEKALRDHICGYGNAQQRVQRGADVLPKAPHFLDGLARVVACFATAVALPLGVGTRHGGEDDAACEVNKHIQSAHGKKCLGIAKARGGRYGGNEGSEQHSL